MNNQTFKKSFERLKEISELLENDEIIDVDKLIDFQKEAKDLSEFCGKKIKVSEEKLINN